MGVQRIVSIPSYSGWGRFPGDGPTLDGLWHKKNYKSPFHAAHHHHSNSLPSPSLIVGEWTALRWVFSISIPFLSCISKFGKKFPVIVVPTICRQPSCPVFCDYEAKARLPITYNISGHHALIMGFCNLLSISQCDCQRIAGSRWEGETATTFTAQENQTLGGNHEVLIWKISFSNDRSQGKRHQSPLGHVSN